MRVELLMILITIILIYGMYLFYQIRYIIPIKKKDNIQNDIEILKNSIKFDKEFELKWTGVINNIENRNRKLRTEINAKKIINDMTEFSSTILGGYVYPIYENRPENFSEFEGIDGAVIYPLTISPNRRNSDIENVMRRVIEKLTETQKQDIEELWMDYDSALDYIRNNIVAPNYDLIMGNIIAKLNGEHNNVKMEISNKEEIQKNAFLENKIDNEFFEKFAERK